MPYAGVVNEVDSDIQIDIENIKTILTDFIGKPATYGVNRLVIDSFEENFGHFKIWVNNYSKCLNKQFANAMYFANNLLLDIDNDSLILKNKFIKIPEPAAPAARRINTSEVIVESKQSYKKEFQLARSVGKIHAIPRYQQREIDPDFKQERFDINTTLKSIEKAKVRWNDKIIRIESCFYFRDANNYPSFGFTLVNSKTLHFPIKAAIRFLNSLQPIDGRSIKQIKEPENIKPETHDNVIYLPTEKLNKIFMDNNTEVQIADNKLITNSAIKTGQTLKDILLENIKNIKEDPNYIPQAVEISKQVGQVINVLRTEMECIRLAQTITGNDNNQSK